VAPPCAIGAVTAERRLFADVLRGFGAWNVLDVVASHCLPGIGWWLRRRGGLAGGERVQGGETVGRPRSTEAGVTLPSMLAVLVLGPLRVSGSPVVRGCLAWARAGG
jgi:hypothetical protein